MVIAIVRYELPASIGRAACRAHFEKISTDFGDVDGLVRKQFIWNENGTAGGIYLWHSIVQAKAFYQGPWLDGILERYGMYPDIEYFLNFAMTENPGGVVIIFPD